MTALLASYNFDFQLGPFIFSYPRWWRWDWSYRLISDRRV